MNTSRKLGVEGEDFAVSYLESKGYKILYRNLRERFGELDIVVKDSNDCLVLVEVKTTTEGAITPEDQMTDSKIKKFIRVAEFFANSRPELIGNKGWRMDVLSLTKIEKSFVIKHYENI